VRLRLAVDANGAGSMTHKVNRLTWWPSEVLLQDYAKNLQSEMKKDIGGRLQVAAYPPLAFAPLTGHEPGQSQAEPLGQEGYAPVVASLEKPAGLLDARRHLQPVFQPVLHLYFSAASTRAYQPLENEIIGQSCALYALPGRIKDARQQRNGDLQQGESCELNPELPCTL